MDGVLKLPCDVGDVSDGYHTFNELYDHRVTLMIALMHAYRDRSWWSELHDDGTMFPGWIIVGMKLPKGQITYHIPSRRFIDLGKIEKREKAPKWDGHTPAMVIERLTAFIRSENV